MKTCMKLTVEGLCYDCTPAEVIEAMEIMEFCAGARTVAELIAFGKKAVQKS